MINVVRAVAVFLRRNHKISYLLTILYMSFIFFLSSIPHPQQPDIISKSRYTPIVEHIMIYSILVFLLTTSLHSKIPEGRNTLIIIAVLVSTVYGILDEIHQYYVPGRYCEVIDICANTIGSLIGGVFGVVGLDTQRRVGISPPPNGP